MGDLQALLNDIQQDEEAKDVHASHGNGPQQVRPEETMLGAHSIVVATCTHNTPSCQWLHTTATMLYSAMNIKRKKDCTSLSQPPRLIACVNHGNHSWLPC